MVLFMLYSKRKCGKRPRRAVADWNIRAEYVTKEERAEATRALPCEATNSHELGPRRSDGVLSQKEAKSDQKEKKNSRGLMPFGTA